MIIIYAYAYTYQDTLAFLAVAFSLNYSAIPVPWLQGNGHRRKPRLLNQRLRKVGTATAPWKG